MWASVGPAISVPIVWGLASAEPGQSWSSRVRAWVRSWSQQPTPLCSSARGGRSLRPNPRSANGRELGRCSGWGPFAALSVLSSVALNIDNVLIAATLGSAEVTSFAVAWRLLRLRSTHRDRWNALWGSQRRSTRSGDLGWIRQDHADVGVGTQVQPRQSPVRWLSTARRLSVGGSGLISRHRSGFTPARSLGRTRGSG